MGQLGSIDVVRELERSGERRFMVRLKIKIYAEDKVLNKLEMSRAEKKGKTRMLQVKIKILKFIHGETYFFSNYSIFFYFFKVLWNSNRRVNQRKR